MAKDSQEEPGKDMLGEKQGARQALGRAGDTSEVDRIGKWLENVVEVTLCPKSKLHHPNQKKNRVIVIQRYTIFGWVSFFSQVGI